MRIHPLFIAAALVCFFNVAVLRGADKPNILFVIADQWRASALGCTGNADVKTPHLDQFERDCVHFINAVSTLPVCSPTRASLLTGQRALTHGVFINDVPLNPDSVSIAKVLGKNGYDTGFIGKWHMDGHGRSNFIPRERRQGFEYWKVLECTHDYNNSFYYADGPEKLKWDGYDSIAQTRDAQAWLRAHANSPKPFLLFLAWGPPHDPYQSAPGKYRAMYPLESLHVSPNVPEGMSSQARKAMSGYYAHCSALDDCFGSLCETLAECGLDKNTIVVFTADHGDLLGSHQFFNKQQPFDESVRVPLLIRIPKQTEIKPGRIATPIGTEDIMPTLLSLCGVEIPKSVEGLDYSAHLRGGANPSDGAALILCAAPFGQWTRQMGGKEYRGIRTERFTYVRDLNGPWLLFDNVEDPYQMNNLVGKPELSARQIELDNILATKLKSSHDEFLPGARYLEKWNYKVDKTGTMPYDP